MVGFEFNQEEKNFIKILYSDKEPQFSNEICVDSLNIISSNWKGVIDNPNVPIFSFASDTNDLQWLTSQLGHYGFTNFCGVNWVYSIQ